MDENVEACRQLYYSLFDGIKKKLKTQELEHATGRCLIDFAQGRNMSSRNWQNPFAVFQGMNLHDDLKFCLFSSLTHQNLLAAAISNGTKNQPVRDHVSKLMAYNMDILSNFTNLASEKLLASLLSFVYLNRIVVDYKSGKLLKQAVSLSLYYSHVVTEALSLNVVRKPLHNLLAIPVKYPTSRSASFRFCVGSPYPYDESFFSNLSKACFQSFNAVYFTTSKILPTYNVELETSLIDTEMVQQQFNKFKEIITALPGILILSDLYQSEHVLEKEAGKRIQNATTDSEAVLILARIVSDYKPVAWYKQVLDDYREIRNLAQKMDSLERRCLLNRRKNKGVLEFVISDKGKT